MLVSESKGGVDIVVGCWVGCWDGLDGGWILWGLNLVLVGYSRRGRSNGY